MKSTPHTVLSESFLLGHASCWKINARNHTIAIVSAQTALSVGSRTQIPIDDVNALIHPDDQEVFQRALPILSKETETVFQLRLFQNGTFVPYKVYTFPTDDDIVFWLLHNISELKKIETAHAAENHQSYISLIAEIRKSFYNRSEQEIVQTFLETATQNFGLDKAWCGVQVAGVVRPVFHAGRLRGVLDVACVNLTHLETGFRFPLIPAMLERRPIALNTLEPLPGNEPEANIWNSFLQRSQFQSMLAIPVEMGGQVEAGIVFYSLRAEIFDNSVVDYLNSAVKELTRISDEKRLWAKQQRTLKKAKEAAEAAATTKSQFLANISHEIRTPMTSILGYTAQLLDELTETMEERRTDKVSPEDYRRVVTECRNTVAVIQRNAEFLLGILNDILDLSKMEAGKLTVERMVVPIQSFLFDIAAFHSIQAKAKNLKFSIRSLTPLPETMTTDPLRIKQILVNLIGNAIKFTVEGSVVVSVSWFAKERSGSLISDLSHGNPVEGTLRFSVKDTGIGIAPEYLSSLFVPFQQGDASTTRRFGGTGLGLAISKRLIYLLGGELTVASQVGHGSTFTVALPQTLSADTVLLSADDRFGWDSGAARLAKVASGDTSRQIETTVKSLAGLRILLAEDGRDSQRLFVFILSKAGADVTVVDNGRDAYQKAWEQSKKGTPFDIILMDIQMPMMDGYTATTELRKKGCTVPVIALTAYATPEEQERCRMAGCNDYATKPILRDALIDVVRRNVQQIPESRH